MFEGLHPDVALVQEVNYGTNSVADLQHFADLSFGPGFTIVREAGAQIPNAVISRYPVLTSGTWTDAQVANRGFTWAQIDLPGPRNLWAISVHLLTSSAVARALESDEIMVRIGQSIPIGDWIVLGGDFNTGTRSESCVTKLSPRFATGFPYPADQLGNSDTSANRSKPHDWVLLSNELASKEVPLRLGVTPYPHGLVLDTRVYTPLTDIAPALLNDSAASGMQHMPVAKDVLISP